ncbi:MAG TPA: glycoside hydrolase family 47 protein [Flavisolibacter sp.]|jgi:mannosidase alpha-like ER degradation enhancer 2|nr:glycoside hydrolase family 47 protein [Flavisolibacter sp.]
MKKLLLALFVTISFGQLNAQIFSDSLKQEMRSQVVEACRHAWTGYKQFAWGFDDFQPLTRSGKNWYNHSLQMTPVDAFDTFILLGMKEEADEAKKLILSRLNFNTDNSVQVFEVTIRLLGGLQSAYEIDGDKKFLELAKDLADRLLPAFNTPTGMPYRYVHLQTGALKDSINNPAEIGTLMMEFGKLSKLTGDKKYYDVAKKAMMEVYKRKSKIGLVGLQINVINGNWTNTGSAIGAYIDSYYEYLYKCWKLFGDKDFKSAFDTHQKAIQKYLVSKEDSGWFLRQVDMNTGKQISTTYGALDAFYAALCAYAGDVSTAKQIQKANYYMWTKFNIEPEEFDFKTNQLLSAYYMLRPENLESCFYLYRFTKDDSYLWMGKRMVEDIIEHCRNEVGYASLKSVLTYEKSNSMQSFFFAETLKYAYLIFAPDDALDFDKVVLNTEAHPLKIPK